MSRVLERLSFLSGAECSTLWIRRSYSAFKRVGSLGSLNPFTDSHNCNVSHDCQALAVPNSNFVTVLPYQHRRSMSKLIDMIRRKKRQYDEEDDDKAPEAKTLPLYEEVPKVLTEEEIEAKRDISGLNYYHRRLVNGQHPYPEPMTWVHHTVRYKQKVFGQFGEGSGVNPGILWPTHEDLQRKMEYEEIRNPLTIQELVAKKQEQRRVEKEAIEKRVKFIEERMKLVDKFKEDLRLRQEAKEKDANEAKARREKLMEEVRRHFGYTVDTRDEKFQELLIKKEKEEKKKQKEARKLDKETRMLEKLQGKSASEKSSKTTEEAKVGKEVEND